MANDLLYQLEQLLKDMRFTIVGEAPYLPFEWKPQDQGPFSYFKLLEQEGIVKPQSSEAFLEKFHQEFPEDQDRSQTKVWEDFFSKTQQTDLYTYHFPEDAPGGVPEDARTQLPLGVPLMTWEEKGFLGTGLCQTRRFRKHKFVADESVPPEIVTIWEPRLSSLPAPIKAPRPWDVQACWRLLSGEKQQLPEKLLFEMGYINTRDNFKNLLGLEDEVEYKDEELAVLAWFEANTQSTEVLTLFYSVMDEMWVQYYALGYLIDGSVIGFKTYGFTY